jgi:hypothetical protein
VQKFCDIAKAGDTCWVHEGTYRESVTLSTSGSARQPITIRAIPGDTVTISGCDEITGWTLDSGNIYKASFSGNLGRGYDQLFENSEGWTVREAREPDCTTLIDSPTMSSWGITPILDVDDAATSGIDVQILTSVTGGFTSDMVGLKAYLTGGSNLTAGRYTISGYTDTNTITLSSAPDNGSGGVSGATCKIGCEYDSTTLHITNPTQLTQSDDYWNEATVHAIWSPRYHACTAKVTDFDAATDRLVCTFDDAGCGYSEITDYGIFALSGIANCLDQAGEWYVNYTTDEIFYWATDNADPDTHTMEVRQRSSALTLNGDYAHIIGIQTFGGEIVLGEDSSYCKLENVTCQYPTHYSILTNGDSTYSMASGYSGLTDTGIIVQGSYHIIDNCTIQYSAGNGVSLLGHHNIIKNSTISECNYMLSEAACISTADVGTYQSLIDNCILHTSPRAIVNLSQSTLTSLVNSTIYQGSYGDWSWDDGAFYAISTNGRGAEIANNYFRDNWCTYTIYFDSTCWNWSVHHNVIEEYPDGDADYTTPM